MFWGTGNHLGLFLEVILVKVPLVFIKVTMAKMACPNLVSLTFWGNLLGLVLKGLIINLFLGSSLWAIFFIK